MNRHFTILSLLISFIFFINIFIYNHHNFNKNNIFFKSKVKNIKSNNSNEINNLIGCCYDIGFGKLNLPIYNNYRSITFDECNIEKRFGGKTLFNDMNCSELKKFQEKKFNSIKIKKKDF